MVSYTPNGLIQFMEKLKRTPSNELKTFLTLDNGWQMVVSGRQWSPVVVYGRPRSSEERQWSSMVVQSAPVVATGRQSKTTDFLLSCS